MIHRATALASRARPQIVTPSRMQLTITPILRQLREPQHESEDDREDEIRSRTDRDSAPPLRVNVVVTPSMVIGSFWNFAKLEAVTSANAMTT